MEFKLDKRHLIAGSVVALLLSTYLLYAGLSKPELLYNGDNSVHSVIDYGISCRECHRQWFQEIENSACVACHGLNSYRRLKIDKSDDLNMAKAKRAGIQRQLDGLREGDASTDRLTYELAQADAEIAYFSTVKANMEVLVEAGNSPTAMPKEESEPLIAPVRDEDRAAIYAFLASQRLHNAVADRSCNECHLEHKFGELEHLLHNKLPERRKKDGYFQTVHQMIPPDLQGEMHCRTCHLSTQELALSQ